MQNILKQISAVFLHGTMTYERALENMKKLVFHPFLFRNSCSFENLKKRQNKRVYEGGGSDSVTKILVFNDTLRKSKKSTVYIQLPYSAHKEFFVP